MLKIYIIKLFKFSLNNMSNVNVELERTVWSYKNVEDSELSNKNLEKSINNTINTNENLQENKTEGSITKKDLCPRCGGKLIKRHGPYGNFYGCENFSTTNCRYIV